MKKKRLVVTAAVLLGVLLLGIGWQYVMERIDEEKYPAQGSYVSTDAYDMHYVSEGQGEFAVVFITGSGTPCAYTDFYDLQEALSSNMQTIIFDHAGSGWSTNTDVPRTVENLEAELLMLLNSVAPGKQIILVCHSLGSLEAIYFAQCHPDMVEGIVFLDSGTPEFYRTDSETTAKLINRGIALTRVTGLNRLLGMMGVALPFYGEKERREKLPKDISDIDQAMFYKQAGSGETLKSIGLMNENAETVYSGPRLGSTPILVLSSDSGEAWSDVQNTLAGWSDNSRHYTIKNAAHYLHWSDPREVEQYIIQFIDEMGEKL